MELLRLGVFVLLIQVSLAVWQRLTVKKGQTVDLKCPVTDADRTNVDWKNPEGYIMFFKHSEVSPGVRDKRYSINKLSQSEFNVRISDVTFKDGGNYTCSQYGERITEKIVEVTVLGHPKITRTKHDGRFDIKCSAEGNSYPPLIFWKFNHGPEILAHYQVLHEDKKYLSMAILRVQSVESRVTVKCLVRHPALHSQPLMNFVKIGQESKSLRTTTTSSPTARPPGSTEGPRTTTSWFRPGKTTVYLATTDVNGPSSESSIKFSTVPSSQLFSSNEPKTVTAPTGFPLNTVTTPDSRLAISDNSTTSVLSDSTSSRNDTISNATSSTGWASVSATTEITSYNSTEGNRTGRFDDPKMRTGSGGGSSLLVFLVTCLICGLLVVVIFFAIKLRRAHIAWKRENEDSDPSEESSKSKSSQEDKNSQGQRRRGIFNTAFTQYVVEEPPVITSVVNTAAMAATESANEEQTSQHQTPGKTFAKCDIKETEL
ncbi:cytotoxic and regulatory T-cell molecule isoform X2 [Morone saxatilis]|uniref:cytotoxic and regulatory T-cell molecule isoform X2 n=1 Tax=Morone saxatilis TaxID=34816 RepID=UPI0015E24763|nr:cytotoxic and regulatory T-cell molecule isoform X2 [Morone saxatilis]